ncbi:MAG: type II secretion system protein, partial [bacterium]|nr:type II secretion system protein [bacterium]
SFIGNTKLGLPTGQAGLTMIELVVVISIFGILSGTALFKFSSFTDLIASQNLTQNIAFRIRQAQNSAVSGVYPRLATTPIQQLSPADPNWKPSYGIYFDISTPKQFVYFFDRQSNKSSDPNDANYDLLKNVYDDIPANILPCIGASSECIDTISITTDQVIKRICQGYVCSNSIKDLQKAAIVFVRPFPDMVATENNPNPNSASIVIPEAVTITVGKPGSSADKYITVTSLGQISVH